MITKYIVFDPRENKKQKAKKKNEETNLWKGKYY